MRDRVLLIGCGGREHAMAEALARSGARIYSIMLHKNPGIARLSKDYLLGDERSVEYVMNWKYVKYRHVDIAFIGPEAPLTKGMADALEEHGIPVVGPTQKAAMIEGSKEFMRDLMKKHGINGLVDYYVFTDPQDVKEFLKNYGKPFVVKPVGLTGGKGVRVMGDHFTTVEEGIEYAVKVIEEGIGGEHKVIIEEKLVGEEFTLQAFTDGTDIKPMPLVQDFKRAYEDDKGPNTGGMGSYSCPNHLLPFVTRHHYSKAVKILEDIVRAMKREGITYRGIIYGQFMHTAQGPKVVEINCRFGDPEGINVLGILEDSLLEIGWSIVEGKLSSRKVTFADEATVVKYVVPEGYGTSSVLSGRLIRIDERAVEKEGVKVIYASVNEENGKLYTTTSRSVALFARGPDLYELSSRIESAMQHVSGPVYYRRDIARRDMIEAKIKKMKELLGEAF